MIREGLVPDRSMSGTVLYLKYSIWLTRSQKKCYPQTWFTIVKRSFNLALADTASFKKMSISFYWIFGILKKWIIFLAVQDNSIGDLASQSVIESCFDFRAIQSLQSLRLASDVWLRSWCLVEILKMNLIKICVWTCDMTSRSYFSKMNSTRCDFGNVFKRGRIGQG